MKLIRRLLALNMALLLLISLMGTAFAAVLTPGEPLEYSIGTTPHYVEHTFTAEQTGVYVFHLETLSDVSCGNLALYDGRTQIETTEKPDSWSYSGTRYSALLEAGKTYTVRHTRAIDAGDYRLTVDFGPYTTLQLDQPAAVAAKGDEEFVGFLFLPEQNGWYTFTTDVVGTMGVKYDDMLTHNCTDTGSFSEYMYAGKAYYLELKAVDNTATGTIRVSHADFPVITPDADLQYTQAINTAFYVSFTPETTGSYTVSSESTGWAEYLTIYDANGTELLSQYGADSAEVNYRYTAGKTYYIAVTHGFAAGLRTVDCTVRIQPSTTPYNPFEDVAATDYFCNSVLWAVENGITTGVSNTLFRPDNPCTRAQVMTFLWRAAGEPEPTITEHPFTDLAPGSYFYKAVLWAYEKNITTGVTATEFRPNNPCTRAQVVTFLYRTAGEPEADPAANSFDDVAAGAYYANAVNWAVSQRITTGISASTFAPDRTCTRAQIVTFLYRAMAN